MRTPGSCFPARHVLWLTETHLSTLYIQTFRLNKNTDVHNYICRHHQINSSAEYDGDAVNSIIPAWLV